MCDVRVLDGSSAGMFVAVKLSQCDVSLQCRPQQTVSRVPLSRARARAQAGARERVRDCSRRAYNDWGDVGEHRSSLRSRTACTHVAIDHPGHPRASQRVCTHSLTRARAHTHTQCHSMHAAGVAAPPHVLACCFPFLPLGPIARGRQPRFHQCHLLLQLLGSRRESNRRSHVVLTCGGRCDVPSTARAFRTPCAMLPIGVLSLCYLPLPSRGRPPRPRAHSLGRRHA